MRNPFPSDFRPVWRVLGRGRELRLRLRRTFHVQLQRTFAPLVVAAMAQTRRTSVVWVEEDGKDGRSETGGASERVVDLTVAGNTPKRRKKPDEECVIVREIKVCARDGAAKVDQNAWKERKERQKDTSEAKREAWPRCGRWEHDIDLSVLERNRRRDRWKRCRECKLT